MEDRVEGLIERLHEVSEMPVAVGFGVSGPEQVVLQPMLPICILQELNVFGIVHVRHMDIEMPAQTVSYGIELPVYVCRRRSWWHGEQRAW